MKALSMEQIEKFEGCLGNALDQHAKNVHNMADIGGEPNLMELYSLLATIPVQLHAIGEMLINLNILAMEANEGSKDHVE